MLKLRVMNSTGAGKTSLVEDNTSVADVLNSPEFSGLLVGNCFALNGGVITESDLHKKLIDLGADTEITNVLIATKPANGAV